MTLQEAIQELKTGDPFEDAAKFEDALKTVISAYEITDEQIINYALHYVSHKDLKPANKGLIKDALIIAAKAFRDGKISKK